MSDQISIIELRQQAKMLEDKVKATNDILEEMLITGQSNENPDWIEINMNGRYKSKVIISPNLLHHLLKDTAVKFSQLEQVCGQLSELITETLNNTIQKVSVETNEKFNDLTADLEPNLKDSSV